jgi:hypothetical protein
MNSISPSTGTDRWAPAALPDAEAAPPGRHPAAEGHDLGGASSATTQTDHGADAGPRPGPDTHASSDAQAPTLLQSIERQYGMAPGSLRYDNPQDLRDARMIPVFKIEGGGRIHEQITEQAAKNAKIPFSTGLDKGTAWPDVPCENPKSVEVCYVGTGWNEHTAGTLANRSHHGDLQFWHSMAPTSDKPLNNGQVVDKIVQQAKAWYAEGVAGPKGNDFPIGKMLHMVQDSYSASHVVRDKEGRVQQFQGYDAQDPGAHSHADKKGKDMKSYLDVPGARGALNASTKLLEFYARRAPFSEVESYLRQQVYPLAPSRANEPAGGSAPPYVKKAVEA